MLNYFNHLWRIVATGFCFACFGIGGIFLTVFVFPLQKLFIKGKAKQKQVARKTVHYTFKFFIGLMAFTGIFSFDLVRARKLSEMNSQLVLANHPSLIDVVVLISIIPNADCVVKAHLFTNPFLRGVVKSTGYISNADPEGLLVDCKKSIAAGNNLIIFPEGTRTTPGQNIKFQRGAANIALRCLSEDSQLTKQESGISTVLIQVKPTTLTKSEPWYKVPAYKAQFSAELIDNSLEPSNFESSCDSKNISKQVRHYNQTLQDFFVEALSNTNS
ncbi:1-acyl-sn-glycerol-3-phosphate acyltransferase [Colwellia sp. 75C3]|uniref:lysophospholipid acyltransferase family protein n=1 Tax=Colwellia sp. 75C3 TaxID=888425 RepID=UPI000C32D34F|nr:lysophospholipid acyltransferase family protein [Colwellia sp. 75C3]PKG82530.1 1-acyl-sn-glycerol-3-phosphate acyltransferase [Colwellia sp. 75C3]